MMDVKKGIKAGLFAGFGGGILFLIINLIYPNFLNIISSSGNQPILLIVVFEFLCGALGSLCGLVYIILDNKKLHEKQWVNNLIRFLIIFPSFAFGILIISAVLFDYPEIISAGISAVVYCCLLEVFLKKFKWGGWKI